MKFYCGHKCPNCQDVGMNCGHSCSSCHQIETEFPPYKVDVTPFTRRYINRELTFLEMIHQCAKLIRYSSVADEHPELKEYADRLDAIKNNFKADINNCEDVFVELDIWGMRTKKLQFIWSSVARKRI